MNKKSLLLGCGSKWGAEFTKCLVNNGYTVDLVTQTGLKYPNVNNIIINWQELDREKIETLIPKEEYDLVFFNQNSKGSVNDFWLVEGNVLPENMWNKNYFIDCQLPYYIVHHLGSVTKFETKFGWMMTGLITGRDENLFKHAGYACNKASNLHIMRGFSKSRRKGIYFAINPSWFPLDQYEKDSIQILKIIENLTLLDSGKSFNKDGSTKGPFHMDLDIVIFSSFFS